MVGQIDSMTAAAVREDPQNAKNVAASCGDGGTAVHQAMARAIRFQLEGRYDDAKQEWLAVAGMEGGKDDALAARAFYSAAYLIVHDNKINAVDNGLLHEAISLCDKALDLKPDFADALCCRGDARVILELSDQYEAAVKDYSEALRINPGHMAALVGRGSARTDRGHPERAMDDFNKALDLKPDFVEALCYRGNALMELDEYRDAIADYDKALGIKPDDADALCCRANALMALDKYEEAIADCDKALSIDPDCAEAFLFRSMAKTDMEQLDEALEDCNKALKINPYFTAAFEQREDIKFEMGRPKASLKDSNRALRVEDIKECNEILRVHPERADVLNLRGMSKAALKIYDEAMEDLNKALSIRPDYAYAFYNRGVVKLKLGDYSGAVDDLEKARELDPEMRGVKRRLTKASAKLAKQRAKGNS